MENILLIFSSLGAINSLVLIAYFLLMKRGIKLQNYLLALLIFGLTLRISKSVLHFSLGEDHYTFLLTIGLSGFLLVGPALLLFTRSVVNRETQLRSIDWLHFGPAALLSLSWLFIDYPMSNHIIRRIVYSASFTQNIIYIIFALRIIEKATDLDTIIARNMRVMVAILLTILLPYTMNSYSSAFHYIIAALVYGAIVYFTLIVIVTKGAVLEFTTFKKYEKAGISDSERERIFTRFEQLMIEDQIYRDNTLSLTKLARQLSTNTHRLSQVINENKQQNFFETLNDYRIEEAKLLLRDMDRRKNITQIALDVGYNSLSAFYRAFKMRTGETPKEYRGNSSNDD